MVGILLSFWVSAYFQGQTVSFREGRKLLLKITWICFCLVRFFTDWDSWPSFTTFFWVRRFFSLHFFHSYLESRRSFGSPNVEASSKQMFQMLHLKESEVFSNKKHLWWYTPRKLTAKAPKNGWLEDENSFWETLFSGAFAVSFREGIIQPLPSGPTWHDISLGQLSGQVYTLQLDPHSGLLDEKDLVQRLQKIQSLKPGENADRTVSFLWAG